MTRALLLGAGLVMLFGLGGCPFKDDYYIDTNVPLSGSSAGASGHPPSTGGTDASLQGGKNQTGVGAGGSTSAGTAGFSGVAGGSPGGAPETGQAGELGATVAPCVPSAERCNGHDDNCNDLVDELACSSDLGCTGFTLSIDPSHGYMFCSSRKDWAHAKEACAAQDMRLVALGSAAENSGIAKKLDALTTDTEVLIGANDQNTEGTWVWDGGGSFWKGTQSGNPQNGAFEAWASASPDNYNNEDCGVISPSAATWADRSCAGTYGYVCEDR
jgi:hypothetical protein